MSAAPLSAALAAFALAATIAAGAAQAAETVTLGAIFGSARDGDARAALETAADMVNIPHQGLEKLPLGAGQGLPRLGGAKIAVMFADDLGNPSVAQAQALRLITREHVAALIGGGAAPEILAATALAERRGVPFLVPDAADPKITGRGFRFVFRPAPLAADVARGYGQFLNSLKAAGRRLDSVALVVEDNDAGRTEAGALREALKDAGFSLSEIGFPANATDLSAPAAQLAAGKPDAAIFVGGAAEAVLWTKTLQSRGYKPAIEIGDDAGFSDPGFIPAVGNLAQGLINRSVWSAGEPRSPAAIVNDLYRAKAGRDLDDDSARLVQGFLVLADAINRAGSTDPTAIQQALQQTDLKPGQLIVGYDGVKFDATGQNTLASTYLTQLQGKQFVAVWPPEAAPAKLILPFKGWE